MILYSGENSQKIKSLSSPVFAYSGIVGCCLVS